jgi:hypothetical protein
MFFFGFGLTYPHSLQGERGEDCCWIDILWSMGNPMPELTLTHAVAGFTSRNMTHEFRLCSLLFIIVILHMFCRFTSTISKSFSHRFHLFSLSCLSDMSVICQSVLSASALSGYLSVCTVCVCTVRLSVSLHCLRLHCQVVCQSVLSASTLSGCLSVCTVCVYTVRLSVSLKAHSFLYSRLVRHPEGGGGMTRPKQMIRRGAWTVFPSRRPMQLTNILHLGLCSSQILPQAPHKNWAMTLFILKNSYGAHKYIHVQQHFVTLTNTGRTALNSLF